MESGEKSLADLIEQRREEEIGPFEPAQIHKVVQTYEARALN